MELIRLDNIIEDIGSQSRSYFSNLLSRRDEILQSYEENNEEFRDFISEKWDDPLVHTGPFVGVMKDNYDFIFIFRMRANYFNGIQCYDLGHFRNSIISNILFGTFQERTKSRLDKTTYLNYYYRFMRKNESIDNLTQNVCFELQEIIKQLIDKELSLYRNNPTAEMIDAIRWRLTSENLSLMARTSSSLNMRK